jgi:hypothetical protein
MIYLCLRLKAVDGDFFRTTKLSRVSKIGTKMCVCAG